jgi:hypothetical protein
MKLPLYPIRAMVPISAMLPCIGGEGLTLPQ